ncbi:MAG: type II toxin-antitoxin system VapC family toxin [Aquihabitans sp.]
MDASVVVAWLIDDGEDGRWAAEALGSGGLAAPHLMPVEVASTLRRRVLRGELAAEVAALALSDLDLATIDLYPYGPFGDRIWELRETVTAYDAWYVAMGEALDAPVASLDGRLARALGPRCRFLTPER